MVQNLHQPAEIDILAGRRWISGAGVVKNCSRYARCDVSDVYFSDHLQVRQYLETQEDYRRQFSY